jgi:hypothetical protein
MPGKTEEIFYQTSVMILSSWDNIDNLTLPNISKTAQNYTTKVQWAGQYSILYAP